MYATRGLEHVWDFMIERKGGNFVLDKANFVSVASSYDEKIQRSIKIKFAIYSQLINFLT